MVSSLQIVIINLGEEPLSCMFDRDEVVLSPRIIVLIEGVEVSNLSNGLPLDFLRKNEHSMRRDHDPAV